MKLESLNNSKYSLTPEKMGKLIGGQVTKTCSGEGRTSHGKTYSADYTISYSGNDVKDGILEEQYVYFGEADVARRDSIFCGCK